MFGIFKQKLQSVQQDFTDGLEKVLQRGPQVLENTSTSSSLPSTSCLSAALDADAGADLLHHYQRCWQMLHEANNANSSAAAVGCSLPLIDLQDSCRQQLKKVDEIAKDAPLLVSQLKQRLADLANHAVRLQSQCDEVETTLRYLEAVTETLNFEAKRLNSKYFLALYRERRMTDMSERKERMSEEYLRKIQQKERLEKENRLEKQKLYQQAFEQDLQLYRATGVVANTLAPFVVQSCGEGEDGAKVAAADDSELTRIAGMIASGQLRGDDGRLAALLRDKLTAISSPVEGEGEQTPPLGDTATEEELSTMSPLVSKGSELELEHFLADKLEDSGISADNDGQVRKQ